ncbi:MAG TPA: BrxA/BrxB family bacilliredoxin [Bryobacteraceae bacterium]|nr:BrxA/BrxB family bacilliredoxin [Bryobacteraceae bacterium]
MRYPEHLIGIMREDLTLNGVEETRTPEEVDAALAPGSGTVLMIVNSVCGCAAGKARPGVVRALQEADVKPDRAVTVFAGADLEAVSRVRELMVGYPPSSPSFALFQDGKPVYMMHRFQIEGRNAEAISADLKNAFAEHGKQAQ